MCLQPVADTCFQILVCKEADGYPILKRCKGKIPVHVAHFVRTASQCVSNMSLDEILHILSSNTITHVQQFIYICDIYHLNLSCFSKNYW